MAGLLRPLVAAAIISASNGLVVTPSGDANALASALFLGTGVTVTSASFAGSSTMAGIYTDGAQGIGNGVILTTGRAIGAVPGQNPRAGTVANQPGSLFCGSGSFVDRCLLTVNIDVPADITQLTANFIFGTAEYNPQSDPDSMGIFFDNSQRAIFDGSRINALNYFPANTPIFPPASGLSYQASSSVQTLNFNVSPGPHQFDFIVCDANNDLWDTGLLLHFVPLPPPSTTSSEMPSSSEEPSSATSSSEEPSSATSSSEEPSSATSSSEEPSSATSSSEEPSSATSSSEEPSSATSSSEEPSSSTSGSELSSTMTSSIFTSTSLEASTTSLSTTSSSILSPTTVPEAPPTRQGSDIDVIHNYRHSGCIGSSVGFPGFTELGRDERMTTVKCIALAKGSAVVGIFNRTCYSSESLENTVQFHPRRCNHPCPGDNELNCGGLDTEDVTGLDLRSLDRRDAPASILMTFYELIFRDVTVTSVVTTTVVYTTFDPEHSSTVTVTEYQTIAVHVPHGHGHGHDHDYYDEYDYGYPHSHDHTHDHSQGQDDGYHHDDNHAYDHEGNHEAGSGPADSHGHVAGDKNLEAGMMHFTAKCRRCGEHGEDYSVLNMPADATPDPNALRLDGDYHQGASQTHAGAQPAAWTTKDHAPTNSEYVVATCTSTPKATQTDYRQAGDEVSKSEPKHVEVSGANSLGWVSSIFLLAAWLLGGAAVLVAL